MLMKNLLNRKLFDETAEGGEGAASTGEVQTTPPANEFSGTGSDGSVELDFEGISNLLSSDPFAEDEEEGEPSASSSSDEDSAVTLPEGAKKGEPGKDEESAEGEQTGTTAQGGQNDPMKVMQETVAALIAQNKALLEAQQGAVKGKDDKSEDKGKDAPEIPEYQFQIPDKLMQLIDSEDPVERRQGLALTIQGTAKTVHENVLGQVQGMFKEVVPQMMIGIIQQQNAAKAIFEDFYGTHKDLNRKELKPLIVQTAQQIFEQDKAQGWTPELRDKIAKQVKAILTAGAGTLPSATPPKTPKANPSGNRQTRSGLQGQQKDTANDPATLLDDYLFG